MGLSVQSIMLEGEKNNLKLIAGHEGLLNQVSGVHIVEDKDNISFLHGQEIIFTTGVGIKSFEIFDYLAFADQIVNYHLSAWVLNVGPYIKEIPDELIEYCNRKKLPLFTIPWSESLIDVTYGIMKMVIMSKEQATPIAEIFRNIIYKVENIKYGIDYLEREGFHIHDKYKIIYMDASLSKTKNLLNVDVIKKKLYTLSKYSMFIENDALVVIMTDATNDLVEYVINEVESSIMDDTLSIRVGVSNNRDNLFELDKIYKEAVIASKVARVENTHIKEYKSIGLYQLVYQIDDSRVLDDYINSNIAEIVEYDNLNNTNYLEIIKLYILYDGSIMEIADRLKLHRNTINYKIKFIKQHFKLDMTIERLALVYIAILVEEMKRR